MKRKSVDMAIAITIIFAVSGFFSILVDAFGLRSGDAQYYEISLGATVAYCGLLTMCWLPFATRTHLGIVDIEPIRHVKMLKFIAWFSLVWFVVTTILSWQNMMNVLTGDMEEYRRMVYQGVGQRTWMNKLPETERLIVAIINSAFGCKWALMFLAFFSRYVQRLPRKYFMMFMLSSLSGPLSGIIGADRSATAYWIMSVVAMYLLYRPLMDAKEKRIFYVGAIIVIVALSAYLMSMTFARFGEREYGYGLTGAQGGLIAYFGQPFINFCVFYDTYTPPFTHLGILFPFTYQYLFGIPTGGVVIQGQMGDFTGFDTGVFYTYIGQIIMAAGRNTAIIFCVVYTIVSSYVTDIVTRSRKVYASQLYLYFALASVMFLGIFVHYYTSSFTTFGLVTVYLILRMMR